MATEGVEVAADGAGAPFAQHDPFEGASASTLAAFFDGIADPAVFLLPSPAHASQCGAAMRAIYRVAAEHVSGAPSEAAVDGAEPAASERGKGRAAAGGAAHTPLPELHVDGFDAEQIWTQVEAQTDALLRRSRRLIQRVPDRVQLVDEGTEAAVDDLLRGALGGGSSDDEGEGDDEDDDGDEGMEDDDDDDVGGASKDSRKRQRLERLDYDAMLRQGFDEDDEDEDDDDDGGDDGDGDEDEDEEQHGDESDGDADDEKKLVEDEFLRLDDMERFVQQAEAAEARGDRGGLSTFREDRGVLGVDGDDDDEDDESVDLFADDDASDDQGDQFAEGFEGDGDEDDEDDEDEGDLDLEEMDGDEAALEAALRKHGKGGKRRRAPSAAELRYEDFFGRDAPYASKRRRGGAKAGGGALADDPGAEGDDAMAAMGRGGGERVDSALAAGPAADSAAEEDEADLQGLSTHEKRVKRLAAQMAELEAAAMSDKAWQHRGEASARTRPVNSALEVDLDFEQTLRPPPAPTHEMAASLEDMIKGRVRELRFDNVVRVLPAEPEARKVTLELDDGKSKAGLAELYEKDYLAAASGTVEDKHAKLRSEARMLFTALCAKLDALSHLSFTPKPVLTDLEVKVDVPAIAMEEAAPVTMSAANMRAPEELLAAKKDKALKTDAELSQAERKQRRAKKKRIAKRKADEKEVKSGVATNPKGMRSAREELKAAKEAKEAARQRKTEKYAGATSGSVFKKLADEQAAGGAAAARNKAVAARKAADVSSTKSSQLKL